VADWIIEPPREPLLFPIVHHRHPIGTLDTVRDHTPDAVQELHGTTLVRWVYRCPCGSTWILERPR
jgi:hypothetical protein